MEQRDCCREHDDGDGKNRRGGLAAGGAPAGGFRGLGRLRPGSSCCVHQGTRSHTRNTLVISSPNTSATSCRTIFGQSQ